MIRSCGSGSLLAMVTSDGCMSVVDVAQAADKRPAPHLRLAALRHQLGLPQALNATLPGPAPTRRYGGSSDGPEQETMMLAGSRGVGTSLLFPRWVTLAYTRLRVQRPDDVCVLILMVMMDDDLMGHWTMCCTWVQGLATIALAYCLGTCKWHTMQPHACEYVSM